MMPKIDGRYLLDTDTASNLLDVKRTGSILRDRVRQQPLDSLAISIITVDEMLTGHMDRIRALQSSKRSVVTAYAQLQITYDQLRRFAILPFTEEAELVFDSFPATVKRIGVNDCRIAAVALVNGCTLITSNTRHFERVPGVIIEDWTRE